MRAYVRVPLKDRFEEKVMPIPWSGCWIWVGGYHGDRGCITDDAPKQKTRLAHRVSYELYKGAIPEGMCVCHTCDIPACVNPAHLWLGTNQENTADRTRKGRTARNFGERQGAAKMTWNNVEKLRKSDKSGQDLALIYGISQGTVSNILNGKTWKTGSYKRVHKPKNETLSEVQVSSIKKDSRSNYVIASEYGVCYGTIYAIKTGRSWKMVE